MSKNINDFNLFGNLHLEDKVFERKAYRVNPKNLWIYLDNDNQPHKVHNISFSGISFHFNSAEERKKIVLGKHLRIHLFSKIHNKYLTLIVQVVRIEQYLCSCFFPIIVDRDESMLDKIVLEVQKEEIMQHKKEELEKEKLFMQQQEQHRKKYFENLAHKIKSRNSLDATKNKIEDKRENKAENKIEDKIEDNAENKTEDKTNELEDKKEDNTEDKEHYSQ